jgi:hypothetical protein
MKLNDIIKTEKEARQNIEIDIEKYRSSLIQIRDKNVHKKYDTSLYQHLHSINKPYEFSYYFKLPNEVSKE